MGQQLKQYVAKNGSQLIIGHYALTVLGISVDDAEPELAAATFKSVRTEYVGVYCANSSVVGKPGAEVWAVLKGKGILLEFAVFDGKLYPLS